MDKKREFYSMLRFFTVLFAVLMCAGFWLGATGYDGSDSDTGMAALGCVSGILFSLCLGGALGLRDQLKAPVVDINEGKDAA